MKKKFNDWYFIPFISVLALPLLIYCMKFETGSKNYFAFLTTLVLAIIIKKLLKLKPFTFVLLSFPAVIFSIIYLVQVLEYDTYVNISTWATLLDTYTGEIKEFISGLKTTTILAIILVLFTYIGYLFMTYNTEFKPLTKKYKYIAILLLLFFIGDYFTNGATAEAFPLKSIQTLYDYLNTKRIEKEYLSIKENTNFNPTRLPEFKDTTQETIIFIIGEALRRDRLEYYGYKRPTTPLMKKEDLIIYTDVVSAANQTINSLKRVFTMAEYLNEEAYWKNPSFIKAFKEAGFKTYWLSNQPVYGRHESQASYIAKETEYFLASNNSNYFVKDKMSKYDGILLKPLKEVLLNKEPKKVIFLHILGNHSTYKLRYPKEFNYFNKAPSEDYRVNLLREYDNAVRYNDYFLYQVLSQLKKQKGEKSFIMFSDHGESLFDKPDQCYHGSAYPSKSEVEIPLILWFSDEFKKHHPNIIKNVIAQREQPVLSSDFFHAFPPLFGIYFKELNPKNNFFALDYVPKKHRKIVNVNLELKDYDKLSSAKTDIKY